MTDDPERDLALSALDHDAQADDLLSDRLKEAAKHKMTPGEIWDQRVSFIMGTLPEESTVTREQVIESCTETYGPRPADDLLKPTEERARVQIMLLRSRANNMRSVDYDNAADDHEEWATLLETLLAENKALRHDVDRLIESASWQNETHVLVPREPTEAMLAHARGEGLSPLWNGTISAFYRAMLTAAQEGE